MAHAVTHHFEWEAPEFKHYEKSAGWYVVLFIGIFLLVAYQILTADYFGAITMVILGILIALFALRKPSIVQIKLSDEGITLGDLRVPYKHFQHFWIVNTPDHRTLNLEASTYLKQTIIIELADQDPNEIRQLIGRHVPEAERNLPSLSQRISRRFKF